MKKVMTRVVALFLTVWITGQIFGQSYNYAEVLQKSMFFYECQESGELWPDNRVTWRANSAMNDGSDAGTDLTGGWYDAGDHVKFNFPMAFSATALAWGGIDFADGYNNSGQMQYLKRNLRWVNDYFIKCHTAPNELWGQVGNGGADHAWWGSAEVMKMDRPAYKIDASAPGSDLAAETAAAMAAASILFQSYDPAYAATLIQHAEQLYSFADNYRGVYSESITDAAGYYRSYSGYNDELVWGAIWLYRATGDQAYLNKAEDYYANLNTEPQSTTKSYRWGIAWDDKSYGCYALLAKLTGKAQYIEDIERHLDYWTDGFNGEQITYTSGGLAYLDVWGALRYANNTGFLALYYQDMASTSTKSQSYFNFALSQANYALGDNPRNSSYVVGFGNNPTQNPHHRTAHGAWANNQNGPPENTRHVLYGALAGGPNSDDSYEDDRSNYINNEVACDYNACFSGVMAALAGEYGGSPLSNFPVVEEPGEEYFTGAIMNSNQDRFFEWSVQTFNHTAWPSREGNNYKFQLFVDITEGLNAGLTLADYTVSTNNSSVVNITQLQPWDESSNIYYTEVTYVAGTEIWPGGDQYDSKEAQIRVGIPNDGPADGWDVTNDPSYSSDMLSGDRSNPPKSFGIPLYVDGELVFGNTPDAGVSAESVSLNSSSETLDAGETVQLSATVLPADATNKNVSWSSSNTLVATVSSTGYVTAVSPGSATITVTTLSGGHTDECDITVNAVEVTGVSLNSTSAELDINESLTLSATVTPSNASDLSITWSSSNDNIAIVNSSGVVTGVGEGQATITAQSSNPSVAATCVVDVSDVIILPRYDLSVSVVGGGTINLNPSGGTYDQGTVVELEAVSDAGYQFAGWSGDLNSSDSVATITMDSDKNVTATFNAITGCGVYTPNEFPLTIDGEGEYCYVVNGTLEYVNSWNLDQLTINGIDYTNIWAGNIPADANGNYYIHYECSVGWGHMEITGSSEPTETFDLSVTAGTGGSVSNVSGSYTTGTVVSVTATPDAGYEFSGWSGDASGTSETINVTMDSDKSVVANFAEIPDPDEYTLTVVVDGEGTVTPGTADYTEGTVVTLTAEPAAGYEFSGWSGDASGSNTTVSVTMDSEKTVTATFTEIPDPEDYTLTIIVIGEGTTSPAEGDHTYTEGSVVTLSVAPSDGWELEGISGDISGSTIIMDGDKTITVTFVEIVLNYYTLTVSVEGNGSVSVSPDQTEYLEGSTVTLTPIADAENLFDSWSGDASGSTSPLTITMDSDKSVTATFAPDGGGGCDNPTTISLSYTQNGEGEYCWFTTDDISYVNSWNTATVEINGVDFTNTWSNSMPAKIDGGYYIYYDGPYAWSHFEATSAKSARDAQQDIALYPNPFSESLNMEIHNIETVNSITVLDQLGRVLIQYTGNDITNSMTIGQELPNGVYYMNVDAQDGSSNYIINKN